MARIFIALLLLLVALAAVPMVAGNTGYILISFGDWAVDGTAVAFIAWAVILLLAIWTVLYMLVRGRRLGRRLSQFFTLRSDKKITYDVETGMVAFAEENWPLAQKVLSRVAEYTEHKDSYLMLAAYAAANQGNSQQAFDLVHRIESEHLQLKAKRLAIALDDGELLGLMLKQGDDPSLAVSVALEKQDWEGAASALIPLKPSRKLSAQVIDDLYQSVLAGWLPYLLQNKNMDAMLAGWQRIPKRYRSEWPNVRILLPLLVSNGKQDEALSMLKPWLKRQPEDAVLADIATLPWRDAQPLIVKVENWLKKDINSQPLLTALGHLARRNGDNELAQKALARVVNSNNNSDDWLAYAQACEQVGDKQEAVTAYKNAAECR